MSRLPDVSLSGLVSKGEARGQDPRQPADVERLDASLDELPPPRPPMPKATAPRQARAGQGRGLGRVPRQVEPVVWTGSRVPVSLAERVEAIVFRSRRTKQDLILEWIEEGVERLERELDGQA